MAKRILIVDDDPDLVDTMKIVLEANGYVTSAAADTTQAMARLREKKPDLIVLDIMMRTKSEGIWFAQHLREDPARRDIPILVLTGVNRDPEMSGMPLDPELDAQFLPSDGFLEKPVDTDVLLREVARLTGS